MSDLIEILKVTGPAVAILLWLTVKLWKRLDEKERKIEELYHQLLEDAKRMTLTYIQLFQSQSSDIGKNNALVSSCFDFLNQKADELKSEIEKIKSK